MSRLHSTTRGPATGLAVRALFLVALIALQAYPVAAGWQDPPEGAGADAPPAADSQGGRRGAAAGDADDNEPAAFLVVYKDGATDAEVDAARTRARSAALPVTLLHTIRIGGGANAASAASAADGATSSPPPPPLRIDVVSAPAGTAGSDTAAGRAERRRVARALAALPGVDFVEDDAEVVPEAGPTVTQNNVPSWGLSRIDQRSLPLDNKFTYPASAGTGATVYLVDTGVDVAHPELAGRASWGVDLTGEGEEDKMGHATHIAGTIVGGNVGVAKHASLVAVKVLRGKHGRGRWSRVIRGLSWAQDDCNAKHGGCMCIVSLSLSGPKSRAANKAVRRTTEAGMIVVVAAGNQNANACRRSPASEPSALVVGGATAEDARAKWSNFGECVDVYAPGSRIYSGLPSAMCDKPPCYASWSGTSMAVPHVTGAAALAWAELGPAATARGVVERLVGRSTPGAVSGARMDEAGTLLAYVQDGY